MGYMKSGELRHRIVLQYPKRTPDSYSSQDTTWTTTATVWAAVWPLSARILIENQRRELEATHRFRIRYRANINQDMRIQFKGKNYQIVSIINWDEKNVYLDILATDRI